MTRPFFKWIVSADAAEANTIPINNVAQVVTRSPIEAHSSNSGRAHLRDESIGRTGQTQLWAGYLPGNVSLDACLRCSDTLATNSQVRSSRIPLSAIEQYRTRQRTSFSGARQFA